LQVADCRLEKQKQPATCNKQTANEKSESEIRAREREMRLLVGATLCVVDRKRKIENRKL